MRFTVQTCPYRGGFTIRDSITRYLYQEDVEGIGLVEYHPPRVLSPTFGWYRLKRDALAKARDMNEADGRMPGRSVEALI